MMDELAVLTEFRETLRRWLAQNLPRDWRQRMLGASEAEHVAFQRQWFLTMRDGGYVAAHWPKKWGGAELSFAEQIVLYEELARAGAPRLVLYFISLYHAPATLLEWGSAEQQARYLPPILRGEEIWCQGFSEPNAGSDLASLKTRAERKGDHYVVNGQKIWSSNAHLARFCLLLARTDPAASKHKGISYFVLDLDSAGVTRRPIRMMTGDSHFNEIFLDDVVIPAANLIGAENGGWSVAQATLSSERGLTILELTERLRIAFRRLLKSAAGGSGTPPWQDDAELRRQLVDLHTRIEALRALVNDLLTRTLRDARGGSEPSIIKVYYSELLQDFTDLGVRLAGLQGQYVQPVLMGGGYETGYWMHDHLYSWSWTIAGGTNEIQRNIIAERALGLPKGVDR
jgi:alkylation response protein AidB-like acyl-CoA dehydrogenase